MSQQRHPANSLGQHIYEYLASLDTRNSFIPEWREVSPAEQQAFEAAVVQRLKAIRQEQEDEEADMETQRTCACCGEPTDTPAARQARDGRWFGPCCLCPEEAPNDFPSEEERDQDPGTDLRYNLGEH